MSGLILEKAREGKVPLGEGMEAWGVWVKAAPRGIWSLRPYPSGEYLLKGVLATPPRFREWLAAWPLLKAGGTLLFVCVCEGGHQNSLNWKRQLERWPHSCFCLGSWGLRKRLRCLKAVILAGGGFGLRRPESPGTTGTPLPPRACAAIFSPPLSPPMCTRSCFKSETPPCLGESLCLLALSLPGPRLLSPCPPHSTFSGRALIHAQSLPASTLLTGAEDQSWPILLPLLAYLPFSLSLP